MIIAQQVNTERTEIERLKAVDLNEHSHCYITHYQIHSSAKQCMREALAKTCSGLEAGKIVVLQSGALTHAHTRFTATFPSYAGVNYLVCLNYLGGNLGKLYGTVPYCGPYIKL